MTWATTNVVRRVFIAACVLMLSASAGAAAPLLHVKAIYTDLDGTALDTTRHVRQATIDALREFRKRGGHVGIATGRTLGQADEAIRAIEPDLPVIVYNGAAIAARGSDKLRVLGHLDSASVAISSREFGEGSGALGVIAYYPDKSVAIRDTPEIEQYAKAQSLASSPAGPNDGEPIKILAYFPSQDALKPVQEKLRAELGTHAKVVNASRRVLDIVPEGIDKLVGIREALRGTSIQLKDVLAFGDGENDVEMLAGVGLGW